MEICRIRGSAKGVRREEIDVVHVLAVGGRRARLMLGHRVHQRVARARVLDKEAAHAFPPWGSNKGLVSEGTEKDRGEKRQGLLVLSGSHGTGTRGERAKVADAVQVGGDEHEGDADGDGDLEGEDEGEGEGEGQGFGGFGLGSEDEADWASDLHGQRPSAETSPCALTLTLTVTLALALALTQATLRRMATVCWSVSLCRRRCTATTSST